PRSSFTQAYEKQILLRLVNSTVQDTSIKEDIGYEAIMGIIDLGCLKVASRAQFSCPGFGPR
ncbi:MAG TPA: transposase family protein, partial [Ktedonobacteraceae bacterium]